MSTEFRVRFEKISDMLNEVHISNPNPGYKRRCIFVITKNNHQRLEKTLHQFKDIGTIVFVLDDSTNNFTRDYISNNYPDSNIIYHGRDEQNKVIENINVKNIDKFIRRFGIDDTWGIGYSRNYAVLLAHYFSIEQAILMDDDILVHETQLIKKIFSLLTEFNLVGAKTTGMPDHSVIGHMLRKLGIIQYDFISGQFFGFNVKNAPTHYFPNIYNEDWIVFILEHSKNPIARFSQITQLPYAPFDDIYTKSLFQEPGELMCEGLIKAIFKEKNKDLLFDLDFWREIQNQRKFLLTTLVEELANDEIFEKTLQGLIAYNKKTRPVYFKEYMTCYFNNLDIWYQIIEKTVNISRGMA